MALRYRIASAWDRKDTKEQTATLDHVIFRSRDLSKSGLNVIVIDADGGQVRAIGDAGKAYWAVVCKHCDGGCERCGHQGFTKGDIAT